MTTRVWYENGSIQITGIGSFPASSLYTAIDPIEANRLHVYSLSGNRIMRPVFNEYQTKAGASFADINLTKAYLDGEFAKFDAAAWSDVTGKPASYPPSAHTHAFGDLTGIPSAFPPTAHTHAYSSLTGLPTLPVASDATPAALAATASAGSASAFARGDHVHPLPSGRLVLVGTYTISETALVTLALSVRRYTFPVTGLAAGTPLFACANGVPTNGGVLQDIYAVAAGGSFNVGALIPVLSVASNVSIPIAVYKLV